MNRAKYFVIAASAASALVSTSAAQATIIYKSVTRDGHVTYSNLPSPNAMVIEFPDISEPQLEPSSVAAYADDRHEAQCQQLRRELAAEEAAKRIAETTGQVAEAEARTQRLHELRGQIETGVPKYAGGYSWLTSCS